MAYVLTAVNVAVDELHHLARIESVVLSEIDEEAAVTLLRHALLALLAVTTLTTLLAVVRCGRLDNLRGVGVILKEAAELQRNNLLEDVLLVEVLEVTVDILHERSNLILVHVHLLYLVNGLEELLGADFLRCGQRSVHKFLAYNLLDGSYLALLLGMYDGDGRALLAGTTGTS